MLLQLEGIRKSFSGVEVLKGVQLQVDRGEVHALVGENGAGKSTLMKVLSGAHQPDEGTISIDGERHRFRNVLEARRAGVIMVYQELALVRDLSVAENLFLGRLDPVVRHGGMRGRARELLDQVGLDIDPATLVRDLGIGEQQLVTIARAIGEHGRLLILDEPTAALSAGESARLFNLIRKLQKDGLGIIYISHRLEEVFALADRVTVLRDGNYIVTSDVASTTTARIVHQMVGRELGSYRRAQHEVGETRHSFEIQSPGGEPFSFEVREGEILGMAGVIGSGRSDALEAIFGKRGSAVWNGERLRSPQEAIRHGIFFVPGDRKTQGLVLPLSAGDNMTLASLGSLGRGGIYRGGRARRLVAEQIEALNVRPARPDMRVDRFSGGNQQKVVVGKALATRPRILLLAEPTRGVDVGARAELYDKLHELAGEGLSIIVSSSDTEELAGLCDRILVFRDRRPQVELSAPFTTEEVTAHVTGAKQVA